MGFLCVLAFGTFVITFCYLCVKAALHKDITRCCPNCGNKDKDELLNVPQCKRIICTKCYHDFIPVHE